MGNQPFNNTVSRLLIIFCLVHTLLELTPCAYALDSYTTQNNQLIIALPQRNQTMNAWFMDGSDPNQYEYGINEELCDNKKSGYIRVRMGMGIPFRPIRFPGSGFGTLMQIFKADHYRNKRMRFTAVVKTDAVYGWAGLWMRVDGPKKEMLGFDNMSTRPINGTTGWQRYSVVLDVPQESVNIGFGILLNGFGQVSLADVRFEETDDEPTGPPEREYPDKPSNLDFSNGI